MTVAYRSGPSSHRLFFVMLTGLMVMIPAAVAVAGLVFADARPTLALPIVGSQTFDPVESSLWFAALWIAIARQLRKKADSAPGT